MSLNWHRSFSVRTNMHTLGMLGLSPVALSNKREAKNHSENFLLQRRCGRVIIAKLFERELKSTNGLWRSLVAHLTGGQGVAGSNPVVPTSFSGELENKCFPTRLSFSEKPLTLLCFFLRLSSAIIDSPLTDQMTGQSDAKSHRNV